MNDETENFGSVEREIEKPLSVKLVNDKGISMKPKHSGGPVGGVRDDENKTEKEIPAASFSSSSSFDLSVFDCESLCNLVMQGGPCFVSFSIGSN